jgi:GDP-L-fucose synthase
MKILVTGADGLVGSALRKTYHRSYENRWIFSTKKDTDLTNEGDVEHLIKYVKPDAIIHTAAKVGGIGGNLGCPAEYYLQNLLMNSYIIHYSHIYNVKKLIVFSSVCAFPDGLPELEESKMHDGPVYMGNFAYGYAKRMVDVQISAYKQQYGIKNYISLVPGNIFGERDNYHLEHGHVIPVLIHKIYKAVKDNTDFYVWGDGSSQREFIYSQDLADIISKLLRLEELPQRLIVSTNRQISIKEVVETLVKISGFKNKVVWQTDKPNGQRSRPSNLSLLHKLVKHEHIEFEEALASSYNWFRENYPNVRGI